MKEPRGHFDTLYCCPRSAIPGVPMSDVSRPNTRDHVNHLNRSHVDRLANCEEEQVEKEREEEGGEGLAVANFIMCSPRRCRVNTVAAQKLPADKWI